ncbi:unnamed protein product [Hermetia illucens]|uniref:Uncharacterized protein n=1 Tax=Hermetia illucens TaxID=343691 RepID=A0A7R8Z3D4_HERIL|nr:uncharacterized protein LOC119659768 [Hermetia illucens]CAD7091832.1 unnamed protein product [Hermetia illucens]
MDFRAVGIAMLLLALLNFGSGQENINEVIASGPKPMNWMKSAQNILAGPAGQMMVQFAKELISRSSGSSQILSLNLGNFFVLLILKALIFAVSMIGAGNWNHYARRMDAEETIFSAGEPSLLIGYLAAQGSGRDGCLHKAACKAPRVAFEYSKAGKALLDGIEMFQGNISDKARYQNLINLVEKSAFDGYKGAPCDLIYRCDL